MARLGKLPVEIPEGVTAKLGGGVLAVKGSKGEVELSLPREVEVFQKENTLTVGRKSTSKQSIATQGTIRSHIVNLVHGVTEGWARELEISGAGYRAELSGKDLVLHVGYSHPVTVEAPKGVNFDVDKNKVTVSGSEKQAIGQAAARIRQVRPPNVYTGSGIKYADEQVRRKQGKQAAKSE